MRERRPFPTGAAILACALLVALAGCRGPGPNAGPRPGAAGEDSAGAPGSATDELGDRKVARAEELLAGRFAGVDVYRLPSGDLAVRIRGSSSILGDGAPLFVLDGMSLAAGPGGALRGINPADIVHIEVLKDIGATSRYGMQGANGVVLITTRRPPGGND